MLIDEPPPMTRKASSRSYPEIAAAIADLKAARDEYSRASALAGAVWLLDGDELAAMTALVIDRLSASVPENWT